MKKRSATAVWKGGLKDGLGHISTEAGALNNVPYNFSMRFEDQKGTNPEELVAAAHYAVADLGPADRPQDQSARPLMRGDQPGRTHEAAHG